ncbi:MAG: ATP-dependent Clp protease ATP-binding subunit, partial [Archangium sp.]
IHTVVGAGAAEGAIDASNMLKPALARGELRCIGATTLNEYRKNIEKDPALERRFQPVLIKEPSVEDTIAILRGLKERYEVHHGVRIKDSAIVAAATLSDRYIADRFLPDKAVDLIDEAASHLRIELDSLPAEIDTLERRIMQLEIELQSLKSETDPGALEHRRKLEGEIGKLKAERDVKKKHWSSEREVIKRIQSIRGRIEELKNEELNAQRAGDLAKAAEIRYGRLVELNRDLEKEQSALAEIQSGDKMLKEEVEAEDVAAVVANWTGIPVSRMMETEVAKLIHMEERLQQRVIGQEEPIHAVSNALRRARSGLQDPNRPIGSFIFMGPTGVGKTETARALADYLFNDENAMLRFDMSEYMERHTVSRLLGAPPGYVGYEEAGRLTEAVRRRPYSVLLFDEVEKAHPDVFHLLLQILDDGRLTDSRGRTVDFKNTVIIMTSNLGAEQLGLQKGALGFQRPAGGVSVEDARVVSTILDALRGHFRPEFLNRIDEVIVFHPLNREQLNLIVDSMLDATRRKLHGQNVTLRVGDAAKDELARRGFDPKFGARPLRRVIQRELETELSRMLLRGELREGDRLLVDFAAGKFSFQVEGRAAGEAPAPVH